MTTYLTKYYVNNNRTRNPWLNHEVHTQQHAGELGITDKTCLGVFTNEIRAVDAAKMIFDDANGCAVCCPLAHNTSSSRISLMHH